MIIGINPYIITDGNGQEAVRFYEHALDATVHGIQTFADLPADPQMQIPDDAKDRVMHAHLEVGNTAMMISDTFPGQPYPIGVQVTIAITVDNVEKSKEVFQKLMEGGQEVMALQETPFSPSYGQVMDKFNVTWHVSTHVSE